METLKHYFWMTMLVLALSLLLPFTRTLVFALFGKILTPASAAFLESLFRWVLHIAKTLVRYFWVIVKNLTTPKSRIYQSLADEQQKAVNEGKR